MEIIKNKNISPVEQFNISTRLEEVLNIGDYINHEKAFFSVIKDFEMAIQGDSLKNLYSVYVKSIDFIKDKHPIYQRALNHICDCLLNLYENRDNKEIINHEEHEHYLKVLRMSPWYEALEKMMLNARAIDSSNSLNYEEAVMIGYDDPVKIEEKDENDNFEFGSDLTKDLEGLKKYINSENISIIEHVAYSHLEQAETLYELKAIYQKFRSLLNTLKKEPIKDKINEHKISLRENYLFQLNYQIVDEFSFSLRKVESINKGIKLLKEYLGFILFIKGDLDNFSYLVGELKKKKSQLVTIFKENLIDIALKEFNKKVLSLSEYKEIYRAYRNGYLKITRELSKIYNIIINDEFEMEIYDQLTLAFVKHLADSKRSYELNADQLTEAIENIFDYRYTHKEAMEYFKEILANRKKKDFSK